MGNLKKMRLIANIKQTDSDVKRLMVYDSEDGVYLFGYNKDSDSSAIWDNWFEKIEYAFEASQEYGVDKNDWKEISDPMENCQHDRIDPVRVKGRDIGKPEWGKLEKLVNGEWLEIES